MNWLVEVCWTVLVLLLLARGSSCNLLNWFAIPKENLCDEQIREVTVFWLKEVVSGSPSHIVEGAEEEEVGRVLRATEDGSSAQLGVVWKTVAREGLSVDIGFIRLRERAPKSVLFITKPTDKLHVRRMFFGGKSYCEVVIERMLQATLRASFGYATYKDHPSHFISYMIYTEGRPHPLKALDDKWKSLWMEKDDGSPDHEFLAKYTMMMKGNQDRIHDMSTYDVGGEVIQDI